MATIYTARAFRPDRYEVVARHLQKLRTGDEVDKSLYQCLHNIRGPNETYLFWKTDPPCLELDRGGMLHFHCILSEPALKGLIRLSEHPILAAYIGSIGFGIHRVTKEAYKEFLIFYQDNFGPRYVPKHLTSLFEFTREEQPSKLLAQAMRNFMKHHNGRIEFRICDEEPLLEIKHGPSDVPSRRKYFGLDLYGENIIHFLPGDIDYTLTSLALAVDDSKYPLRRLSLQYGLEPQRSGMQIAELEDMLGLVYCQDREGSKYFEVKRKQAPSSA